MDKSLREEVQAPAYRHRVGVRCVLVVLNWLRCIRYVGRGPGWRFRDRGVIATWVGGVFRSNFGFEEVGNVVVSEVVVSL